MPALVLVLSLVACGGLGPEPTPTPTATPTEVPIARIVTNSPTPTIEITATPTIAPTPTPTATPVATPVPPPPPVVTEPPYIPPPVVTDPPYVPPPVVYTPQQLWENYIGYSLPYVNIVWGEWNERYIPCNWHGAAPRSWAGCFFGGQQFWSVPDTGERVWVETPTIWIHYGQPYNTILLHEMGHHAGVHDNEPGGLCLMDYSCFPYNFPWTSIY